MAPWKRIVVPALTLAVVGCATAASAQSLHDALTFLLTNRSIPTDDFVRDEESAAATSAAMASFVRIELGTLPVSTSAGGFTYRLDRGLGVSVRTSDSFGPFFTERALTAGARQITLGFTYQQASFQRADGRALKDGALVATASRFYGDDEFFDVETLSLRLQTDTTTFVANAGITDRLDVGGALPFVRVSLSGQRVDTYRGRESVQATATGTTRGPGDVVLRAKYNVVSRNASGFAVGSDLRLPTGDEQNLRGAGETMLTPRAIASVERGSVGVHGNAGYTLGGVSRELDYGAAATVALSQRLTLAGELVGRRLTSIGRLTETVATHPSLVDVETVRLSSATEPTTRATAVFGAKWNPLSTWLVSANVIRPLTDAGLTARWTFTVLVDHSFGR